VFRYSTLQGSPASLSEAALAAYIFTPTASRVGIAYSLSACGGAA